MTQDTASLPPPIRSALEHRKARWESFEDLNYVRLTDSHLGYAKGTVQLAGRLIPGYPHIGRIFRLKPGLRQQFPGYFWAEEKMDGYNVRVARVGDRVVAITRGGYLCPFTSDRLPDLLDLTIFEQHPDLIPCAEIVGPDNPYSLGSPPYVASDVQAFVIDLLHPLDNRFLPVPEKLDLADRFGLPLAPVLGRFQAHQWEQVQALNGRLEQDQREGLVLKADEPIAHRTKFVTRHSGLYDISVRSSDLVELPGDFFTGRILRLALGMDEEGLRPDAQLHQRLGEVLMDGLFRSIDGFKRDGRVAHRFRCRFRSRRNAEIFVGQLRDTLGHTHARQQRLEWEQGFWVLEFDKEVPKLTGLLHQLFRGEALVD